MANKIEIGPDGTPIIVPSTSSPSFVVPSNTEKEKKPVEIEIPEEVIEKELTGKDKLRKQLDEILREHDNMESNIPINHEYWTIRNLWRVHK